MNRLRAEISPDMSGDICGQGRRYLRARAEIYFIDYFKQLLLPAKLTGMAK